MPPICSLVTPSYSLQSPSPPPLSSTIVDRLKQFSCSCLPIVPFNHSALPVMGCTGKNIRVATVAEQSSTREWKRWRDGDHQVQTTRCSTIVSKGSTIVSEGSTTVPQTFLQCVLCGGEKTCEIQGGSNHCGHCSHFSATAT